MSPPLVLTVDDDPDLAGLIGVHVSNWGLRSESVHSAAALRARLEGPTPTVLLMDVNLGDGSGEDLVEEVHARLPNLPVIMITRNTSIELAVRCMKRGATDFITKPLDFKRVRNAVHDAIELDRLAQIVTPLSPAEDADGFGIVGESAGIRDLVARIRKVAAADVSALILGETGTGKELVARAIHAASARAGGPFVPVNAAAIPHELIESSLFGHEQGAFTGAGRARIGHCESADSGTLFLDEIGEMDFGVQAKLLRFLQDHVVQPVGSSSGRRVDVRVVAATNIDPQGQIRSGRLREDLYYRLRVVTLAIPPLRERGRDIALLARHFLRRAADRYGSSLASFSAEALEALCRYSWPGNVRELEHVIEEVVVLHDGSEVEIAMLPPEIAFGEGQADTSSRGGRALRRRASCSPRRACRSGSGPRESGRSARCQPSDDLSSHEEARHSAALVTAVDRSARRSGRPAEVIGCRIVGEEVSEVADSVADGAPSENKPTATPS